MIPEIKEMEEHRISSEYASACSTFLHRYVNAETNVVQSRNNGAPKWNQRSAKNGDEYSSD